MFLIRVEYELITFLIHFAQLFLCTGLLMATTPNVLHAVFIFVIDNEHVVSQELVIVQVHLNYGGILLICKQYHIAVLLIVFVNIDSENLVAFMTSLSEWLGHRLSFPPGLVIIFSR